LKKRWLEARVKKEGRSQPSLFFAVTAAFSAWRKISSRSPAHRSAVETQWHSDVALFFFQLRALTLAGFAFPSESSLSRAMIGGSFFRTMSTSFSVV
jgi:hypothetical protein